MSFSMVSSDMKKNSYFEIRNFLMKRDIDHVGVGFELAW